MKTQEIQPRFNLGYVVRETNIKADTLRAWERRYGLPMPQRTEGGHRLYSQEDVDTVRWLMARQAEGLSISKAVRLWHSREKSIDVLPAQGITHESLRAESPALSRAVVENSLVDMRQSWIQACLRFDNAGAQAALSRAFADYPMKDVLFDVLLQGLVEIGEFWFGKRISVQQEHFAASIALQRLHILIADAPPPTLAGRVLVGGAAEELHEFAPLLVNLLLRYRGWEVIYLGPNVPEIQLQATLQKTNAQLVILTAELLHTAANLRDEALFLEDLNVRFGYGGAIFNMLSQARQHIPGHFLGTNIDKGIQLIEDTLIYRPSAPAFIPLPDESQAALAFFRDKRGMIEADLADVLPGEHLNVATRLRLSRTIDAALRLGDIRFADREIDWAQGLIANYAFEPQMMRQFLQAYMDALRVHMDERGQLILDWMTGVIEQE